MAELRRHDGTVRWRGDDPAEALAAMLALGDDAPDYVLVGFDGHELPSLPADEKTRDDAIAKLAKVKLISDKPPTEYRIVNDLTGAIEQAGFAKKADADKMAKSLGDEAPKHEGERVKFRVEKVGG